MKHAFIALARLGSWLTIGLLACLQFAMDVQIPKKREPEIPLQRLVAFAQDQAVIIGLVLLGAFVLLRFSSWFFEDERREVRIVRRLTNETLNWFRTAVFQGLPSNVPEDENRVTLFQHVPIQWSLQAVSRLVLMSGGPWSGWLVITARSGHLTQRSKTAFLAPDKPERCEGVAGQAWRCGMVVAGVNPQLPRLDFLAPNWFLIQRWRLLESVGKATEGLLNYRANTALVKLYAAATFSSSRRVWRRIKKGQAVPTQIIAIRVYDSLRRPW